MEKIEIPVFEINIDLANDDSIGVETICIVEHPPHGVPLIYFGSKDEDTSDSSI